MRMTVPAFKEFTPTRARARKSVWTQHSSWLKRTEERSMKRHLRSQVWGRGGGETEKAQRQEEQDQFAWHEGTRE